MGIGVALLMAAAGAVDLPAQIVLVPLATDPVLARARLRRPVVTWAFAAPARSPDLRAFSPPPAPIRVAADAARRADFGVQAKIADAPDRRRLDLVTGDPEAQMTGRGVRRSAMAAGFSLKVVEADGTLSPLFGMSGPVGKALSRLALTSEID